MTQLLGDWRKRLRRGLGGKNQVRAAYQSGDEMFIVVFEKRGDEEWGRLVNMEMDMPPGPLAPVGSIAAHMPYENFVPFKGDSAPMLERVRKFLAPENPCPPPVAAALFSRASWVPALYPYRAGVASLGRRKILGVALP